MFADLFFSPWIPDSDCSRWEPSLVGMHLVSDVLMGLAYYVLPLAILYGLKKREEALFDRVFLLLAAFLVLAGTTHFAEIWTLWHVNPWLFGGLKALTAGVSVYTSIVLIPVIPKVLALRDPTELETLNQQLAQEVEEHCRTEAELRELSARLDIALKAVGIGIWDWNIVENTLTWDDRFYELYGTTPETFERDYEAWAKRLHPEDRSAAEAAIQQALSNEKPYDIEFRVIHTDGTIHYLKADGLVQRNDQGEPIRMIGTNYDITKRYETEKQLRSQERINRSLFELANIGLAITGQNSEWLQVNPKLCEMLGYEAEEFKPLTWTDLTHPEDLDKDLEKFNQLLTGKVESYTLEKRFITKTGEVLETDLTVGCARHATGAIDFCIASIQDIHDRNTALRQIEESRSMYVQILSSISDAVFVTDTGGRLTFICPNVETIFGYSEMEIRQQVSIENVLGVDLYNLNSLTQKGHEIKNMEVSIRDKWNNIHDLLMNIKSVEVAGGNLLFTCRDISDRKQADLQLKIARAREVQQSQLFRNTFDQAAVGIAHVDVSGQFIRLNRRFCDIAGYPEHELLNLSFQEITHPDDLNADLHYVHQLLAGRISTYAMEKRYIRKDGELSWINLTVSLVKLENGEPHYFIAVIEDINARKQTEEILRLYERIVCTSDDLLSFVDRNYIYHIVNDAYAQMYRRSKTEIINHTISDLLGEAAFLQVIKPQVDRCLAGETVRYQRQFSFNETTHYLDVSYFPHQEEEGEITGIVASIRDITAMHQAEEALSLQARRAEALLELPQLAEQLDEKAFMQQAQDIAENLTGSQIAFIHFVHEDQETIELVTWSHRTLEHFCTAAYDSHYPISQAGIWADALREQRPVIFNDYESYPHKKGLPKGHSVLQRLLSVPVIENGKVVMMMGVGNKSTNYTALDVETVQLISSIIWRTVRHYRSLNTSRLLAAVVNSTDDAIFSKTLDSTIISWNAGAEKLLGYSEAEILNQSSLTFFPTDRISEETQILESLQQGENIHHYETVRLHKDGTPIDVSLTISPLKDRNNQVSAAAIIMRDITERRKAERQIQREMEQRQQLINQLEQTKQILENSNQELQDFAYVASHDLQEPLRKIQAFGDRLNQISQDSLSDSGKDYLARMLNAAARAQALINDLLSFSRVTTRARPLEPTDLNEVMAGVLSDLEVRIEQTGATLDIDSLPTIDADETQIRQVFQNLLGNALKFHKPNVPPQIQVRVRCYVLDDSVLKDPDLKDQALCELRIMDNGIGFDPKYSDRIFQPFQRLHSRTSYEGSGVGLAICRKVIRRHGGTLTAESQPGEGSTFIVTIPVQATQPEE